MKIDKRLYFIEFYNCIEMCFPAVNWQQDKMKDFRSQRTMAEYHQITNQFNKQNVKLAKSLSLLPKSPSDIVYQRKVYHLKEWCDNTSQSEIDSKSIYQLHHLKGEEIKEFTFDGSSKRLSQKIEELKRQDSVVLEVNPPVV